MRFKLLRLNRFWKYFRSICYIESKRIQLFISRCIWWYEENGTWVIKWLSCYIEKIYLLESRNPVFISPNHNFTVYPIVFCSRLPTIIRAPYHPFVALPPLHTFHLSSPNLSRLYCLNRIHVSFFPKIQAHTWHCIFSRFIFPLIFPNWYTYPPPLPYSVCLILTIINFNISFVLF